MMGIELTKKIFQGGACLILTGWVFACSSATASEPVVPGTGVRITQVGDDFEAKDWSYILNLPKSSQNIDKQERLPAGESLNGRWYEGIKRGTPDLVKRVATPAGGLAGSQGALLLRSLNTGIPYRHSYQQQQDDFIADVYSKLGGNIPISKSPSVVVRIFMPKLAEWERRSGCTFAFRAATVATTTKSSGSGFFRSSSRSLETYWPGMLIEFETKEDTGHKYDTAYFRIRADESGNDYHGPQITQTGWWTLGMSFTPDGRIHYYAKPGVEDLTKEDLFASHYPYGFRCQGFKTFFFNVCNADDGQTWSTPWIVDDTFVYYIPQK